MCCVIAVILNFVLVSHTQGLYWWRTWYFFLL